MARGGDRFRRLRTPQTGDLFEHFGVAAAPDDALPPESGPDTIVNAVACEGCGWYRPASPRDPCPLCAAPHREGARPR